MKDEKPMTNIFTYELVLDKIGMRYDYDLAYGQKIGKQNKTNAFILQEKRERNYFGVSNDLFLFC